MTQTTNILGILRTHSPFDLVPIETLEKVIQSLSEKNFDHDSVVLSRTSPLRDLLIVLDGKVDVRAGNGTVASLVPHEAFPLEALQSSQGDQVTGCDYIANGSVRLLVISAATISLLRSASAEFNDFCVNRSVIYQQRGQAVADQETGRSGLNFELTRILFKRSLATLPPQATIREAILKQHELRASLIAIVDDGKPVGIFSSEDLVSRVLVPEIGFDTPVAQVMTVNPVILNTTDRGFDAVVEMSRCGVRHIVLVDDDKNFAGVISDSELLHAQQSGANLHRIIANAASDTDLVNAAAKIRELAVGLIAEGVEAGHLTRLVSKLNDRLVERIVEIESVRDGVDRDGFCWIALGSEGRHEQTLHTDQDNALVFTCGAGEQVEEKRRQMLGFARKVNEILARCGFPLCSGNVMASNPECCLTPLEWRKRFSRWIHTPTPEALLNATIYFDMRPLCGNRALCEELVDWLAREVPHNKRFFHLLTENALLRNPPIGLFRDFVVDKSDGCLDIKLHGLTLLVDGARVLGLAAGSQSSATVERLRNAGDMRLFRAADLGNLIAAFDLMQKIRLRHHNAQLARGEQPNNRINPYTLNNIDRKGLLESLRHASNLQKTISSNFNLAGRI